MLVLPDKQLLRRRDKRWTCRPFWLILVRSDDSLDTLVARGRREAYLNM
jgi:hypothetical protein